MASVGTLDGPYVAETDATKSCARAFQKLAGVARRLPAGGVYAFVFIVLIHAFFSLVAYPHAVARPDLRRKVLALTGDHHPALVFAGDSRAECQIDPGVVAGAMGLEERDIVNIGVEAGDSAMVLAAHREFADCFAPGTILVMSVSAHFVSDRGELHDFYNAEYYWSLGVLPRFSSLSVGDAVRSTFTPERLLSNRINSYLNPPKPDAPWSAGGYRALDGPPVELPDEGYPKTVARLDRWRYFTVGERCSAPWLRFQADLEQLHSAGVQVVVLDTPEHPAFLASLLGTAEGDNYARFRSMLTRFCREMNVPLLQYTTEDLDLSNVDESFWDGVHLNAIGAELLSKRVGTDLGTLLSREVLSFPLS